MTDRRVWAGLLASLLAGANGQAIEVRSSDGPLGAPPETLAGIIVNGGVGDPVTLVVSSVTTEINNENTFVGNRLTNPKQMGHFLFGVTAPGTLLPPENGGPAATYAGGIEINQGVCLCTGAVSDADPLDVTPPAPGYGVGMEGPNNGISPLNFQGRPLRALGTASSLGQDPIQPILDADWVSAINNDQPGGGTPELGGSGDPSVLQYDVILSSPGFLRVSTVFGTDEDPEFEDDNRDFDDSFVVLVKRTTGAAHPQDFENIAEVNRVGGASVPFEFRQVRHCSPQNPPAIWFLNQVVDEPTSPFNFSGSTEHRHLPGTPFYDIEFGGFSAKMTWETEHALAPGQYTVKIVVHDARDKEVDAGLFIERGSMKAFYLLPADFDRDGDVDMQDASIVMDNWEDPAKNKFEDGDANGDGIVNMDDANIVTANFNTFGGPADLRADFNRDGCVDGADQIILQRYFGLDDCANRFLGDANGDAKVDGADQTILNSEFGLGCGGAQQAQAGGGSGSAASLATLSGQTAPTDFNAQQLEPISNPGGESDIRSLTAEQLLVQQIDLNGDGVVDRDELSAHFENFAASQSE